MCLPFPSFETIPADSGILTARLLLEVGGSATSALSGLYPGGETAEKTRFFDGFGSPGDSVALELLSASDLGFYMTPLLPSLRSTWYTETALNDDGYDHALVFATDRPGTYLVAFEDLPENGDADYAPADAEDAADNYRRILEIAGLVAAETIAPNAEAVDADGNTLNENGTVTLHPKVRENLFRMSQADLMGFTLPRK